MANGISVRKISPAVFKSSESRRGKKRPQKSSVVGNAKSETPKLMRGPTRTPSVTALRLNAGMQPSVTRDVTRSPGHLKKSGFHRNTSILSLNHNKDAQHP